MRTCSKCKESKPLGAFSFNRRALGTRQSQCKPCILVSTRAWKQRNLEKFKRYQFRKKLEERYGLSLDQYSEMLKNQGGCCKICGSPQKKRLAVDHCHTSGLVRGLLCDLCNRGLGYFKDSPNVLTKAADYLTSARAVV